jgi:hypothetical protein
MTDAELEQFVVAVMQRLDVLGEQVASLIGPRPASAADSKRAAVLLPAIVSAIGNRVFASKHLAVEAARQPALAAAIVETTGPLNRTTANRLGKLLHRLDGHAAAGMRLLRSSQPGEKSRDGVLWCVNVTLIVTERRNVTSAVASPG